MLQLEHNQVTMKKTLRGFLKFWGEFMLNRVHYTEIHDFRAAWGHINKSTWYGIRFEIISIVKLPFYLGDLLTWGWWINHQSFFHLRFSLHHHIAYLIYFPLFIICDMVCEWLTTNGIIKHNWLIGMNLDLKFPIVSLFLVTWYNFIG